MYKIKLYIILTMFISPFIAKSQSNEISDFTKFVLKTYKVSDSLKYNCEWMFAVVKVKTDARNKIIKYDFVNNASDALKSGFSFLIGYQFPIKMPINDHPVVFYFSIDNLDICKQKPGDFIYYTPNRVVEIISDILLKIEKDDPKTVFIPDMIVKKFYEVQH
ncbi:MAG: hypothetical protein JWR38_630 [Mucilaginibacter sp.]|nr:hypothetical protein [Mucilaginibacter sp.]